MSESRETLMRVAVIADTHGNLISLDTVLDEIRRDGIEQIVCLGDVAGLGAQPRETTSRLRDLGCPVVMGNADEFLLDPSVLDPALHPEADEHVRRLHEMERWCAAQLEPGHLEYIRTFSPTVEIPLAACRRE
jgi:predicted phosphodiesterase